MAGPERWGVTLPLEGLKLADHRPIVQEAEQLGYTDAWTLEVDGVDCFTPLALAAGWTERMRLGTAIANVYTRTPSVLAMQAAGLADAAPGRFVLGLGSSSPAIVQEWGGLPFVEPLAHVREAAGALRELLDGKRTTLETERYRINGLRLSRPPLARVPIYLAALRAGMLRLAGRLGDGLIINWLAPKDVAGVVAVAREAAQNAGRDPDALEVVCRIFVCVTDGVEEQAARTQAKRWITAYLTTPVYEQFHIWLGRGEALRATTAAWRAGDRRGALAAIPEQVVDDLVVIGDAGYCRERVLEYCANGVTTPLLHFFADGISEQPGEHSIRQVRALAPSRV